MNVIIYSIRQFHNKCNISKSIIVSWKPEQIKKLHIPILPKPTQQKIADLVRQSHEARNKAKGLLEKAKREVEKLISGAQ